VLPSSTAIPRDLAIRRHPICCTVQFFQICTSNPLHLHSLFLQTLVAAGILFWPPSVLPFFLAVSDRQSFPVGHMGVSADPVDFLLLGKVSLNLMIVS
jgi:hypothetical protein